MIIIIIIVILYFTSRGCIIATYVPLSVVEVLVRDAAVAQVLAEQDVQSADEVS